MDIPKRVRPLRPTQIVDDASFQGAHETNLSRQTAAFALRCCGNYAHYAYHDTGSSPNATLTTIDTWEDFDFDGHYTTPFDIPWHHQTQHNAIAATLRLVTQSNFIFLARLQSDELVDAVATTEGKAVMTVPSDTSPFMNWNSTTYNYNNLPEQWPGDSWRVLSFRLRLESPTLPATRRIVVRPQVKFTGLLAMSISARFYVESLSLWDEPAADEHA